MVPPSVFGHGRTEIPPCSIGHRHLRVRWEGKTVVDVFNFVLQANDGAGDIELQAVQLQMFEQNEPNDAHADGSHRRRQKDYSRSLGKRTFHLYLLFLHCQVPGTVKP